MSNLNVEPGTSTLNDMIASIEDGLLLRTNVSCVHRRFAELRSFNSEICEWGQRIRGGKLSEVTSGNPNYRGVSRHVLALSRHGRGPLHRRGPRDTLLRQRRAQSGDPRRFTPSPACKFEGVDVFRRRRVNGGMRDSFFALVARVDGRTGRTRCSSPISWARTPTSCGSTGRAFASR